MTDETPGAKRRDFSGAAIGLAGLLVVGIVVVSSSFISRTTSRDNDMERTAADLRVRVALAHLGLESALAGREREGRPAGEVYANLSAARASCQTVLRESRTRWSDQDRDRVRTLCTELEEFRSLTTTRLNDQTTARLENQVAGAGADVYERTERRYDLLFRQIMTRAQQTSNAIIAEGRDHEDARDRVQAGVVVVLVVVFAAMAALSRRNRLSRVALGTQAAGMQHRAFHDPLTDLANRALFTDRVDHALARTERSKTSVAVLFLDLDGFKAINDTLGHAMGDRLLIEVAGRLVEWVRPSDTVARLGGDEFAVLVDPLDEPGEASIVADRILEGLRPPFVLEAKQHFVQASIGISVSSGAGDDAGDLLRNADLAMYVAKAHGKGRHETFEPAMHSAVLQRMELESELRRALEQDELEVHYQPIVDIEKGTFSAVEALARWKHPRRGMVQPSDFIPLAEDTGLIVILGNWVLRQACRQVRQWQTDYQTEPPIRVSVNISARQLQPGLIEQVSLALADCQFDPRHLTLEITESLLTDESTETNSYLTALHRLGIKLAIDDFGTGYSSLSRLRHFPVDTVKIDKSFVGEIAYSKEGGAIVAAMIAMAQSLNLDVVAEGVETQTQLRFLLAHGCPQVQGYLLGRPVRATSIEELLASPLDDLHLEPAEAADEPADDDEAAFLALFTGHSNDSGHLEEVTRLVLAKLQDVTGLDSTFLAKHDGTEDDQEIMYACNGGGLVMREGSRGPWLPNVRGHDSTSATAKAPPASTDVTTYFGVPVATAEGALFGTLCGVSSELSFSAERVVPLMDLFARLIADCLEGSVAAGPPPSGAASPAVAVAGRPVSR